MLRFVKIQGVFVMTVTLTLIVWATQDFLASFAATERTTVTTLRTTQERDDARVQRAFRVARQSTQLNTTLVSESHPKQQTRDSILTVTGTSDRETLEGREAMVKEIFAAFAREGPGEIYDIGNAPYTRPVENGNMTMVRNIWRGLAVALLLFGLVKLVSQWRRSHLPKAALAGILATAFTLVLIAMGHEGTPIWVLLWVLVIPVGLLVLVGVLTARVRRAATWVEGRARITQSKVAVERHRFSGDTTQVKNKASVAYDFKVGQQTIHGDRISLGFAPADEVDKTLKRYQAGTEVPVFYDPANPKDCVLERAPPVSLGCLWSGTVIFLLLYLGGVVWFKTGWSPSEALARVMPQDVHHPLLVIGTGLFGLLCTGSYLWNSAHPRKAFPWLRTPGTVVSSEVEEYLDSTSSSSHSSCRYYKAVIEFSYKVDGQEYHSTTESQGGIKVSVSGDRSSAEAEVARHPVGMGLEVFYDPQNPTRAGLNVDTEMELNGNSSLVMAVIFFAVAYYAARH